METESRLIGCCFFIKPQIRKFKCVLKFANLRFNIYSLLFLSESSKQTSSSVSSSEFSISKKLKKRTTIAFLERKVGQMVKFGVFGMFYYHHPVFLKHFFFENGQDYFFKCFLVQTIRRIGKNNVVSRFVSFQKLEDIAFGRRNVKIIFGSHLFNEFHAAKIGIDRSNRCAATRGKFKTDITGSANKSSIFKPSKLKLLFKTLNKASFDISVVGRTGSPLGGKIRLPLYLPEMILTIGIR